MKTLLCEKILMARWELLVITVLLLGFGVFAGHSAFHLPPSALLEPEPRYLVSDNAISRFGISPVNPQWFEIGQKSGAPLESIPAPDQMVFTFPVEPVIEKIEPPKERSWEPAKWKVIFKP